MSKFRRELGKRIREARQGRKFKQQTLGKRIGVHKGTISAYELGQMTVSVERLTAIAKETGVSVGWLVGEVR